MTYTGLGPYLWRIEQWRFICTNATACKYAAKTVLYTRNSAAFTINTLLSSKRVKDFNLSNKIKNETRISNFTTGIQYCTGTSTKINEARKGNKRHLHQEGNSKWSTFTDNMIL